MRTRLPRGIVALSVLGLLAIAGWGPGSHPAAAGEPTEVRLHPHSIEREGAPLRIDYCSNGSLTSTAHVRRVLLVIHGDGRNACGYAAAGVEASRLAGVLADTLVIAPHFITNEEAAAEEADRLYWSTAGWKEGADSRSIPHPRPWEISSFAVVDDLVQTSAALFPNLDEVVVAGHSAGGQFVNRYAASTRIAGQARFVVANPSSYLYLDARRFLDASLVVPPETVLAACPQYDNYKYGLTGLNAYLNAVGPETLRTQFADREVRYLLGELDSDANHPSLDTGCAAELQGHHRLERGERYHASLGRVYGTSVYTRHTLSKVPAVGHGVRAIFTSPAGREALFGGYEREPGIDSETSEPEIDPAQATVRVGPSKSWDDRAIKSHSKVIRGEVGDRGPRRLADRPHRSSLRSSAVSR